MINPLGPRAAAALLQQNPMRREVTVSNGPSIQLYKSIINAKQKFQLTSYFSPFTNTALYIQQVFDFFFHSKIEAYNFYLFLIPSQKCAHLNVRFLGACGVTNFAKFPVWISKDEAPWICQGAHAKRLSQICRSNLKGWSSDAIANRRAFVYFHASIMWPSRNFENSQHLSNSIKLQTKDIVRSSKQ